ncbi:SIMPL domain-containing protein [Cyanobium sp. ATX 6F1]|uniref:SIMPL domain-containing protein n=1 Tax=Cyanobium sp. ATX 6F1 TaxID=2823702 RepID=UPI0020CF9947|nr:SIMPL domain-containing protein [Cyanobium sp. ATX 6F1]
MADSAPGWLERGWRALGRTPSLVSAMAVLSLGLVVSSSVLIKGFRQANDSITVTGASTERIRSDAVDWTLEVRQGGASQGDSYKALLPAVASTTAFLRAQGLTEAEVQLGAVKSDRDDVRDPRTGELRSSVWTSRQPIQVASARVEKVAQVARAAAQLIGEGVPLTINDPAYTYGRLAEKRVDMLAKATRDARARAKAIAAEAGARIGAIVNADTGSFQITAPNSTETGDTGSYDTRTIDKDITAVMAVTFRVE